MKKHIWTQKQVKSAKTPNYSKLYVVKPALLELFGNVKKKKILELGCGNGFWLKILASRGAKCAGIDKSKNQIAVANEENKKSKYRIDYHTGDAANLKGFPRNYDFVLLEHVLLEIPKLSKIRKILKEAYNVTKKNGHIIVSDLHPIAPNCNLPNVRAGEGYSYFKSGVPVQIVSKRVDEQETYYTDFHWTIEDICGAVTDAGYKITKITEPKPSKEVMKKYPYLRYRKDSPLALMIKAVK